MIIATAAAATAAVAAAAVAASTQDQACGRLSA
eukprot:COSAG06_NODE_3301_length_5534_cov_4.156762_4_plen_33_part_00